MFWEGVYVFGLLIIIIGGCEFIIYCCDDNGKFKKGTKTK
jgi:hypothetical protein